MQGSGYSAGPNPADYGLEISQWNRWINKIVTCSWWLHLNRSSVESSSTSKKCLEWILLRRPELIWHSYHDNEPATDDCLVVPTWAKREKLRLSFELNGYEALHKLELTKNMMPMRLITHRNLKHSINFYIKFLNISVCSRVLLSLKSRGLPSKDLSHLFVDVLQLALLAADFHLVFLQFFI